MGHMKHYGQRQLNQALVVCERLCDKQELYFAKTNLPDVVGAGPREFL
jgi:hypothetical protein